jgi:predicted TIM-barrel fold metal-dependent hydrolase
VDLSKEKHTVSNNAVSADACDCHVHIVGRSGRFPQLATRSYTAGLAPLALLRGLAEPQGITRLVAVQPSFYGTDNSCLLETLRTLGPNGRGVAAVDVEAVTPVLLSGYAERGICGLRINLYSKSLGKPSRPLGDLLEVISEKLPAGGWHVEIIAALPKIVSAAATIVKSKVPIVIDHYGLPDHAEPTSREGRCLLDLLAAPHVWMKLSAPYRVVGDPLATSPPGKWLCAFLQAAPERCVWGSDWPHTPVDNEQKRPDQSAPYRMIDYGRLLRDFLVAIGDPTLAERVLRENPSRLYGFGANEPNGNGSGT